VSIHADEIRTRIKQLIGKVAGLDPARIPDDATLQEELKLDSLSLLEIGVEVDLAFHLDLPDERYREIDSLRGMVALVQARLDELADRPQAAEA
jgi:acyl carrier protein